MNFWLGDHSLFPDSTNEWSTEQLWRLKRCFIAWELLISFLKVEKKPLRALQEMILFSEVLTMSVSLVIQLSASGVEFLMLFLPALSLKSYTTDDPGTNNFIAETNAPLWFRSRTCSLASYYSAPEDHLQQYGLIDVALDPFPNGGCTTTCEALWMGVPVITLAGHHYVSRMSAAVLWCQSQ